MMEIRNQVTVVVSCAILKLDGLAQEEVLPLSMFVKKFVVME